MGRFATMPDGNIAFGPDNVLKLYAGIVQHDLDFNAKARFKIGQKVRIIVSIDNLIAYYVTQDNQTPIQAKQTAASLMCPGMDVGEVIGSNDFGGRTYVTASFPAMSMVLLPEDYFKEVK